MNLDVRRSLGREGLVSWVIRSSDPEESPAESQSAEDPEGLLEQWSMRLLFEGLSGTESS